MNIYLMKKPKRINSVSVTVTLIAALIGYLLWFAIPTYWPSFQMGGIMKGICHDAYRETDNDMLVAKAVQKSLRTGLKVTKDNFRFTRVPLSAEEVAARKLSLDSYQARRGKTCILEFYYKADYKWPLTEKTTSITFNKEVQTSLEQVNYDNDMDFSCNCDKTFSF